MQIGKNLRTKNDDFEQRSLLSLIGKGHCYPLSKYNYFNNGSYGIIVKIGLRLD